MANKKKSKTAAVWRPGEGGYEITDSPEIITQTLVRLKEKRGFVSLLHKGYQSGNTIIIEISKTGLSIDKPVDWPETSKAFRVVFKDEGNVWNHVTVNLLNGTEDTLKTEFPTELFRLQRRRNYRIPVPRGSHVSFRRGENVYSDVALANMSAGGLLIHLDMKNPVIGDSLDASIQDVCINLADDTDISENQDVLIRVCDARIVREVFDNQSQRFMLGVELFPKIHEEKELFKYVRGRELELMRKGIKQ